MNTIFGEFERTAAIALACIAVGGAAAGDDSERRDALFDELFSGGQKYEQSVVTEALQLWTQLAESNDARALYYLSSLYFSGLGVARDDARGLSLVRASADLGLADAQYNLGHAYENGHAIQQDVGAARQWYERAAQQGFWLASERLAAAYERGELGLERSAERAAFWRSKRGQPAR